MSQQHEVHGVDETLRPVKKLEALVAFLEKRRDAENKSEIADDLRRREYLHFGWIGTGRGSSEVLDSFYHSWEFCIALANPQ